MSFNLTLRKIYLYTFATVGLILVITGSVSFINLGLKVFVFTNADSYMYMERPMPHMYSGERELEWTEEEISAWQAGEEERQERQKRAERENQAARALAQLIVGIPLFLYHWGVIRKEKQI